MYFGKASAMVSFFAGVGAASHASAKVRVCLPDLGVAESGKAEDRKVPAGWMAAEDDVATTRMTNVRPM